MQEWIECIKKFKYSRKKCIVIFETRLVIFLSERLIKFYYFSKKDRQLPLKIFSQSAPPDSAERNKSPFFSECIKRHEADRRRNNRNLINYDFQRVRTRTGDQTRGQNCASFDKTFLETIRYFGARKKRMKRRKKKFFFFSLELGLFAAVFFNASPKTGGIVFSL